MESVVGSQGCAEGGTMGVGIGVAQKRRMRATCSLEATDLTQYISPSEKAAWLAAMEPQGAPGRGGSNSIVFGHINSSDSLPILQDPEPAPPLPSHVTGDLISEGHTHSRNPVHTP